MKKMLLVILVLGVIIPMCIGVHELQAQEKQMKGAMGEKQGFFNKLKKVISREEIERHFIGEEINAKGKVIRVLNWNDNITSPCMAVILKDDGSAFKAYVRPPQGFFSGDISSQLMFSNDMSTMCDTLTVAQVYDMKVNVTGDIEELGQAGGLGILAVSVVNLLATEDDWGTDLPEALVEGGQQSDLITSGQSTTSLVGDVIRILNWNDNATTTCMAIIKQEDGKGGKVFVRKPQNYSSDSLKDQLMISRSMRSACNTLLEALVSGMHTVVSGDLESGNTLRVGSVNILKTPNDWGTEYPSAW